MAPPSGLVNVREKLLHVRDPPGTGGEPVYRGPQQMPSPIRLQGRCIGGRMPLDAVERGGQFNHEAADGEKPLVGKTVRHDG